MFCSVHRITSQRSKKNPEWKHKKLLFSQVFNITPSYNASGQYTNHKIPITGMWRQDQYIFRYMKRGFSINFPTPKFKDQQTKSSKHLFKLTCYIILSSRLSSAILGKVTFKLLLLSIARLIAKIASLFLARLLFAIPASIACLNFSVF